MNLAWSTWTLVWGIFSIFLLIHSDLETVARALTGSKRCMFVCFAFLKLFATFLSPVLWHRWEPGHIYLPQPVVLQEQLCLLGCTGVLSPAGQGRAQQSSFLVSSWSVSSLSIRMGSLLSCSVLCPAVRGRHQTLTSCSWGVQPPSHQRGLCSSATLAWQSPNDFTAIKETSWRFSHNGYFGKFFFCTVRMERVTDATIVLGTVCTLVLWNRCTILLQGPHIHAIFSLIIFRNSFQNEQSMPSLKKNKKAQRLANSKHFSRALLHGWHECT